MKHTHKLEGMTCNNCKASVEKYLNDLEHITNVSANLEKGEVEVTMDKPISTNVLQKALPEKYQLSEKNEESVFTSANTSTMPLAEDKTKLEKFF